jgi:hypothetical protein
MEEDMDDRSWEYGSACTKSVQGDRDEQVHVNVAFLACAEAQTTVVIAYTRVPDGAPPWLVQDVCTIRANGFSDRRLTSDGH